MTKTIKHGVSTKMQLVLLLDLTFTLISVCPTSSLHFQNLEVELPHVHAEVPLKELEDQSSLLTYIVHVKKPEDGGPFQSEDFHSLYYSVLPSSTKALNRQRMVFSYRNVVSGFAVKLTAEEAKALEEKNEILSARPEKFLSLHTTHTPSFLGLQRGLSLWKDSNFGKGIIIGVLDTGINPLHPSFSDEGMPSPPAKWKGHCEFTGRRTCNNKLIGARNFVRNSSLDLPFDDVGHGTHTASTAAGRPVAGANVFGQAKGTAIGIAPDAYLAIYKVCTIFKGCPESAILAAMDAAIEDGVDIISVSIGGGSVSFSENAIALGAFSAIQKGILVSCSAGNGGPGYNTLGNEAPWTLTVGASTTDRTIRATARLGNGAEFDGESVFQPESFSSTLLPLVYAGANGNQNATFCAPGSLKKVDDIKGKIVLCEQGGFVAAVFKGQEVKDAGGAAMILMNPEIEGFNTFAEIHVLPAVDVSYTAGLAIKDYINSTSTPTAAIFFRGTVIGDPLAPVVTFFSSRGPGSESPGILKPDIIGPGMNILAAWTLSLDNNIPPFNIISGTSMSCPHLSGIAALLKNSHPDWSVAAIKSAIMTTADAVNLGGKPILDQRLQPADIFATGAGHVNPLKANDPGLIYDIEPNEYIAYLCGLGYNDTQVRLIVQQKVKCSDIKSIPEAQLNYPSFAIKLGSTSQSYTRTLTNVGPANSTYKVKIDVPVGMGIGVSPDQITFTEVKQKVTYTVEFIPLSKEIRGDRAFGQGSINWVYDKYSVRIPISVIFV